MKAFLKNRFEAAVNYMEDRHITFGLVVPALLIVAVGVFMVWRAGAPVRDQMLRGLVVTKVEIVSPTGTNLFTQATERGLVAAGATLDAKDRTGMVISGYVEPYGTGHEVTATIRWRGEYAELTTRDCDPDGTDSDSVNANHVGGGLAGVLSRWYQAYTSSQPLSPATPGKNL